MKATLIVNPNAGGTNAASVEELEQLLREAGFEPHHFETNSEEDLSEAIEHPADLIVAAGGDGTIRGVATRLAGKKLPLSIVPLGTANNIGRAVEVSGKPSSYLVGLKNPKKQAFDIGVIRAPWGTEYFLEGAGLGLFATSMANYNPEEGKSPFRALTAGIQTLREFEAKELKVWLDDEVLEDPIVILEVMNTPAIGPRLRLAKDADPGDGLFDVVLINHDQEVGFLNYASGLLQGQLAELPNVNIRRCRKVAIEWDGSPFHLDAEVRQGEAGGRIEIEVWPAALELWIPSEPESNSQGTAVAAEA